MTEKIAIIGVGKMGGAIARSLLKANIDVIAYDTDKSVSDHFKKLKKQPNFVGSLTELYAEKAPVILAVKPNLLANMVSEIPDDRLVISVAAGVKLRNIDEARKEAGSTLRAMPNLPIQVGSGITALIGNAKASEEDLETAKAIFSAGGEVILLNREEQMHAVTALSGSGPAFVMLFAQALEDGGVLMGLERSMARELALQTMNGSLQLRKKSNSAPQDIIHDITSPGGTTIVGLKALKKFGFENVVQEAIRTAVERSFQLSKK